MACRQGALAASIICWRAIPPGIGLLMESHILRLTDAGQLELGYHGSGWENKGTHIKLDRES